MLKKYRIWLIIALALVIVAAILILTNSRTTLRKEISDFAVRDTASITRIFLADKNNNEVLLARTPSGWTVGGKPAQQAKINSFLVTLAELEVKSPVPSKARNNVIKRMAVIGKKIEVYQMVPRIKIFNLVKWFPREKNTKTYYVGDVTQDNLGTFMLMEGADEPFVIHIPNFRGFVSARYSPLDQDWRDYTVFKARPSDIASIELEFPGKPEESFRLNVGADNSVSLEATVDRQPVNGYDTIRVLNFLASFMDIRFEALLNDQVEKSYIDSVLNTRPSTIITLTGRNNRKDVATIYPKKGFSNLYQGQGAVLEPVDLDRAYALVNDGEDFVLIQYFVFDKVTKPLSYLKGSN